VVALHERAVDAARMSPPRSSRGTERGRPEDTTRPQWGVLSDGRTGLVTPRRSPRWPGARAV